MTMAPQSQTDSTEPQSPEGAGGAFDFAMPPAAPAPASGGNPQEMTPSKPDAAPIGKEKLNKLLEAEYGEVSLDDDDFDENDLEVSDEETGGGGRAVAIKDDEDDDDDNSLVDQGPDPPTKGVCGGCVRPDDVAPSSSLVVAFWLLFWLINNVGLTLLNKATLSNYDFKYPFFLSFFHMACNYVGGELTMWVASRRDARFGSFGESAERGEYAPVNLGDEDTPRKGVRTAKSRRLRRTKSLVLDGLHRAELDKSGSLKMWAFSVIFSLNVAIGNVSLRYVSVNFNQVMRSLVPAVAIVFGYFMGHPTSVRRKVAVVPVIGGVAMACYGEMELTVVGFVFTSLCVLLAALKAVAAGEILTGELKLHPVDLLNKMAPKAAVQCLLLSLLTGELSSISSRWYSELSPSVDYRPALGVLSTGILSFSLNISSLTSNKLTSPLTLCIAANVKQVLMIGMATAIFRTEITALNGAGIGVVLVGSAAYSWVSLSEKTKATAKAVVGTEAGGKILPLAERRDAPSERGADNETTSPEESDGDEEEGNDERRVLVAVRAPR